MIKDYFASKGWLTRYAQAEDSRGMWQKYVDEVEAERVQESRSMVHEPRNMYSGGGLARALMLLKNFNKTGAVKGLEENLIKKYKSQGMEFIEAIKKAQTEARGVRYEGRMKIIDDAMKEANVHSDDYVDLLDMKIKIEDPNFAKQYVKFPENLKNKTRSRHDPDWAEANFGEEYGTKLDQARVKEINESIDPNITERSLVDDIDDMNVANTDEFFGRKKNATGGLQRNMAQGGRTGFEDGMRVMEDKLITNYKTKFLKEVEAGKDPSKIQSFEDYKKTQTEVDMDPGKKKLYETLDNATKIRLAKIGCPGKANGGRIGFNEGQNLVACATRGVEKLQGDPGKLSPGDKSNLRALTKSGKALKFLKGVLGPGAILGELVLEGGIAANKTLNEGVPFKQALGESYLNYALGPKLKIDVEAEREKEFAKGEDYAMAERGRRMMIPQSATADKQRLKKRYEQMDKDVPTYSSQQIDKMLIDSNITREEMGMNDNQINEYIKNQRVADAGGVSNLAQGGLADLMKKYYDKR